MTAAVLPAWMQKVTDLIGDDGVARGAALPEPAFLGDVVGNAAALAQRRVQRVDRRARHAEGLRHDHAGGLVAHARQGFQRLA